MYFYSITIKHLNSKLLSLISRLIFIIVFNSNIVLNHCSTVVDFSILKVKSDRKGN